MLKSPRLPRCYSDNTSTDRAAFQADCHPCQRSGIVMPESSAQGSELHGYVREERVIRLLKNVGSPLPSSRSVSSMAGPST